jgi:HlyD family type I secretion membrane fusion protein
MTKQALPAIQKKGPADALESCRMLAKRESIRSTELAQQRWRAAISATTTSGVGRGGPPALGDSMRSAAIAGWSIIAIFFGGFGAWAMTAPLNGEVVANGFVKIETNRKSVQHLDGGIVKELRVKEGDRVAAGDVLIVLDDTEARAEYDVLWQQYLVLRATEERLRTELAQQSALMIPEDLKALANDSVFSSVWLGQVHQFESRLAALAGQRNLINEKIAQLEAQITGGQAQAKAYRAQLESVKKEREDIDPLVKRGLIAQPRYLQLERSGAGLEGQEADTLANIAKARQAIAEQMQQMAQLDYDRMTEVSKDLRDTQAKLLEVIPKLSNAKAVLGRWKFAHPIAGMLSGSPLSQWVGSLPKATRSSTLYRSRSRW